MKYNTAWVSGTSKSNSGIKHEFTKCLKKALLLSLININHSDTSKEKIVKPFGVLQA